MIKRILKVVIAALVVLLVLFVILNPDRGSFNHTVFEGGPNSITADQKIRNEIVEINKKDYNNDSHPYIQRRNYLLLSVYDVKISDTKEYHILGILQSFSLLNE